MPEKPCPACTAARLEINVQPSRTLASYIALARRLREENAALDRGLRNALACLVTQARENNALHDRLAGEKRRRRAAEERLAAALNQSPPEV